MSGQTVGRRRRALPWGLLGMLVLVGAIERLEVRGNLAFVSLAASCWSSTGRAATREARGRKILCFGDSMVKFGLLPHTLKRGTGRSAYNLALLTGPAPASYVLFRRALESGAKPRAVVVDFAAGILADGPESTTRPYPWSDLLSLPETADLAWSCRSAGLFARLALGHFLPSVRARFGIRDRILADFRGEPDQRPSALVRILQTRRDQLGAEPLPKITFTPVPPPTPGEPPGPAWRCDPVNEIYVRRFLDLAARHQIPVFWVFPPYSPGLQARNEASGEDRGHVDFARAMLRQFPNVVVIDARASGYENSVFFDPCHLDIDGATALSAAVAGIVRGKLEGPTAGARWVSLPRYEPFDELSLPRVARQPSGPAAPL